MTPLLWLLGALALAGADPVQVHLEQADEALVAQDAAAAQRALEQARAALTGQPDLDTEVWLVLDASRVAQLTGEDPPLAALEQALARVSAEPDADPYHAPLLLEELAGWWLDVEPARARPLIEEALALREAIGGPDEPGTALLHNLRAGLELRSGDTLAGVAAMERAREVVEANPDFFGPYDRAMALSGLAYFYGETGQTEWAVALGAAALTQMEEAVGPEHPALAHLLNNQGTYLRGVGRLEEGAALLARALTLREQQGLDPVDLSITRGNLAAALRDAGNREGAIAAYLEGAKEVEALRGERHPTALQLRLNAAVVLGETHPTRALSQLDALQPLIEESTTDSLLAQVRLAQATLCFQLGDMGRGDLLLLSAVTALPHGTTQNHRIYRAAKIELARLQAFRGLTGEAMALLEEVRQSVPAGDLEGHDRLTMERVALLLAEGDDEAALEELDTLRSAPSRKWSLVEVHRLDALVHLGRAEEAEVVAQRVAARLDTTSPETRPQALAALAAWHWSREEREQALDRVSAQLALTEASLGALRTDLSERQQSEARANRADVLGAYLALAPPQQSWEALQRWRGVLLVEAALRAVSRDDTLAALRAARLEKLRQLSSWSRRQVDEVLRAETLVALGEELDTIERELARNNPGEVPPELTLATLCDQLAADEVLVELATHTPFPLDADLPEQLDAYVVRGDECRVHRVGLGPVEGLRVSNARYLKQLRLGLGESALAHRAERVSDQFLQPLEPWLHDVGHLWLVPEPTVADMPVAALPLSDGSLAIEHFSVATLTTARELMLERRAPSGGGAVVVGGVDFGPGTDWSPLPGTLDEQRQVSRRLRRHLRSEVHTLEGSEATEARLTAHAGQARVLHLATHGWYSADEVRALAVEGHGTRGVTFTQLGETPVALAGRSGLALAGANQGGADTADDGLWLEAEVASVDLSSVQLVTLSACETALGVPRRGEGLMGIGRALVVAGARSSVLALWQIPDLETRRRMEDFYRALTQGPGRAPAAALRRAQLQAIAEQRAQLGESLPWTWAGFQVSGRGARVPLER